MSTSRSSHLAPPSASPGAQERSGFRTKTIATRVTPEELAKIESAAQGDEKSLAEWLRELALKATQQRPADPMELLLAELSATRYMLLNLFHATAQANAEGKHLPSESVLKIRDTADLRKLQMARKLLAEFMQGEDQKGGNS